MIAIDFVAGSHGHYMEYVCNRFVADLESDFNPFNANNASHTRPADYYDHAVFVAEHYYEKGVPATDRIVRITFGTDDLLALSSVSLHRAGDYNIDPNLLEQDTYHKLKNIDYEYLIERINTHYPEACISEQSPNCDRHILREYFKFGYRDPEQHGLMLEMRRLAYQTKRDLFDFALQDLYDTDRYLARMRDLAHWYGKSDLDTAAMKQLHQEFLKRQIYRDHQSVCNAIVEAVIQGQDLHIEPLTLFQESYINGRLEKILDVEMPFYQPRYFTHTQQIRDYLTLTNKSAMLEHNDF